MVHLGYELENEYAKTKTLPEITATSEDEISLLKLVHDLVLSNNGMWHDMVPEILGVKRPPPVSIVSIIAWKKAPCSSLPSM